tara:strand:+ start:10639 stop:11286 length:648 start_codon:yes stop_codon:yes gene_type:complete
MATVMVDAAGNNAINAAAAKGVPFAIVIVIVKRIIVTIAGVAGGERAQCVADRLTSPGSAAKITTAAIADVQRLVTGLGSKPAGASIWWALRPALTMCGFSHNEWLVIERGMYKTMAKMSYTNNGRRKCYNKAYAIQAQIDKAANAKMAAKLEIVQAQSRARKAEIYAKSKYAALYRDQIVDGAGNSTPKSSGGGMVILGGLGLLALVLANRQKR